MRHFLLIMSFFVFGFTEQIDKAKILTEEENRIVSDYCTSFPDGTQLSMAFINDNDVSFIGFIKQGDSLIEVNNRDSVFEIASISKVFTATLLSHLLVDSTLNLDEPIENFLPFELNTSNYDNKGITLKTLLNHTSGFPRMPSDYIKIIENKKNGSVYDSRRLKEYLQDKLILTNKPGEEYQYSNLGYTTLGYLIEQIQKTQYDDLLQQKVCSEYGMNNTTTDYDRIKESIVVGRDSLGQSLPYVDLGIYKFSGGIFSTVLDLSKFIMANFSNDKILNFQRQETYRRGNTGMALGWQITNFGGANCKWFFHDGGLDGYRSACFMDVSSKCAVIILSNVSSHHPESDKIVDLAAELLKLGYLKYDIDNPCVNSFIEVALKNGWGADRKDNLLRTDLDNNSIVGVWQQNNGNRVVTRTFFQDNKIQTDFYRDSEIDVWGYYELNGNEITITDIGGAACVSDGKYEYEIIGDTLRFKEILDECDGRKNGLIKDWIRTKR